MKIPTNNELEEFQNLFNEFKNWKPQKNHLTDKIVKTLITPLPKEDSLRIEGERLLRFNRYTELSTLLAPYFYSKCIEAVNELLIEEHG